MILTQILADEINVGYGHLYNEAVAKLDGVVPRDMEDFVARLSSARGVVEIETTSGGIIMLDADEVQEARRRGSSRATTSRAIARPACPARSTAAPPLRAAAAEQRVRASSRVACADVGSAPQAARPAGRRSRRPDRPILCTR